LDAADAAAAEDPAPPTERPAPASDGLLHGRGVSAGTAAAPVARLAAPLPDPAPAPPLPAEERDAEAARIAPAAQRVADTLRARAADASGEASGILEATALIALDPEIAALAEAAVRDRGLTADAAIAEAAAGYEEALAALGG